MWKAVKHGAVLVVYNSNDEEVCEIVWLLCKSCSVYNRVCSRWEITINQIKTKIKETVHQYCLFKLRCLSLLCNQYKAQVIQCYLGNY